LTCGIFASALAGSVNPAAGKWISPPRTADRCQLGWLKPKTIYVPGFPIFEQKITKSVLLKL
jgi:hypothetical protein